MSGMMALCSLTAFVVFLLGRKIIIQSVSLKDVAEEDVDMISTL
jgi:hypothetical protein